MQLTNAIRNHLKLINATVIDDDEQTLENHKIHIISFRHENRFIIFQHQEGDDYFRILLPGVRKVTDENRDVTLQRLDEVNCDIKGSKGIILNGQVWIVSEQFIASMENVNRVLALTIGSVLAYYEEF